MKHRLFKSIALSFSALALSAGAAGFNDLAESMQEMGENATKGYLRPFVQGIGVGNNSQWSYTAKTMSFLGLPIGFNAYLGYPVVLVNSDMKTFSFSGNLPVAPLLSGLGLNMSADSLQNLANQVQNITGRNYDIQAPLTVQVKNVPTIYGSGKRKRVATDSLVSGNGVIALVRDYNTIAEDFNDSLDNLNVPDSVVARMTPIDLADSITLPFRGFDLPIAPNLPVYGVTASIGMIPILNNLTLGFRYAPTISSEDLGSAGLMGFMGKYEFTHLIPVLGKMPFLHFAAYYAQTEMKITAKNIASLTSLSQTAMLQFSADLKFLVGAGIYGGIGWERSSLDVKVEPLRLSDDLVVPGFKTSIEAPNKPRAQIGARLSVAIFDIYADANFGSTTVYNGGVAFGLNGL